MMNQKVSGVIAALKSQSNSGSGAEARSRPDYYWNGNNESRVSLSNDINQIFIAACMHGPVNDVMGCFRDRKNQPDPGVDDSIGLRLACANGHLDIVKFLLTSEMTSRSCNIDAKGGEPLILACRNGHFDIADYLLNSPEIEKHARINIAQGRCLLLCSAQGNADAVNFLLKQDSIDIRLEADAAIKWACHNGHSKVVRQLLMHQKDQNYVYSMDILNKLEINQSAIIKITALKELAKEAWSAIEQA